MYFNLQHSLHMYLETVFGKFLRNITRALRLCNPSDMSLLLRIICGRLRLTTFLEFRHRRFVFPSILNQSTSVPKLGKESGKIPHLRFFLQCSISCRASTSTPSMPAAPPSSFVCRMVVGYPRTLSIVPEQLHHVLFCVESSHGQLCRKSSMERGNGMVPIHPKISANSKVEVEARGERTRVGL